MTQALQLSHDLKLGAQAESSGGSWPERRQVLPVELTRRAAAS